MAIQQLTPSIMNSNIRYLRYLNYIIYNMLNNIIDMMTNIR